MSEELRRELINRLHRLEGHVRGVAGMIERQEPDDQIIVQLAALKAAVNQVMARLLEGRLDGCLREGGGQAAEDVERLKRLLSLTLKHYS